MLSKLENFMMKIMEVDTANKELEVKDEASLKKTMDTKYGAILQYKAVIKGGKIMWNAEMTGD